MDIRIAQKKPHRLKQYLLLVSVGLVSIFASYYLWYLGQADLGIDADTLVLDEVKRGKFTVSVQGSGVLVPDHIEWISASVEGTLVKRAVKPGHPVKKGDLIVVPRGTPHQRTVTGKGFSMVLIKVFESQQPAK